MDYNCVSLLICWLGIYRAYHLNEKYEWDLILYFNVQNKQYRNNV